MLSIARLVCWLKMGVAGDGVSPMRRRWPTGGAAVVRFRWLGKKLVEGFFILLPVLIAYLMLGQLFDGLLALTQPVVDVLPQKL